jgi:hypothetical protein
MRYDHLDMLPEMAFKPFLKRMTLEGKSKAPPPPDYAGAARETSAGNLEAARVGAKANRVSQYTPYGNLVYEQAGQNGFDQTSYDTAMENYQKELSQYNSQPQRNNYASGSSGMGMAEYAANGGGTAAMYGNDMNNRSGPAPVAPDRNAFVINADPDLWKVTQTLSPAEQEKLNLNNNLELGLLGTAQKGLAGVDSFLSKGFDFNALPVAQVNAGQTAQDAIMARLNPTFAQSEEALRTRLINQGVSPGSQAWDNEFRNFAQAKNDAYSQAALQGIDVGNRARQQAIQEQAFGRTEGLNMINALRTGNQVQNPNFINTPQQATTAGPDLLGAATANYQGQLGAYNAEQAGNAGLFGGLASLGGQILSAPAGSAAAGFFSDERLKSDIKRIGTHDKLGIGIYSYMKFGTPEIGVLAQELQQVLPSAVKAHKSGYLMIDLGAL